MPTKISRREAIRGAAAFPLLLASHNVVRSQAAAANAGTTPRFHEGVELGVQSWCFNDRPFDEMVAGLVDVGAGSVEMWSGHVEPLRQLRQDREELRAWRLEVDLEKFRQARRTLDANNIHLSAFNISMRSNWTDAEIKRAFEMAQALGADLITSSSNVSTAARIDPFARRYKIRVAFHNHAGIKPDEFATPEDFRMGLDGFSDYLGINLDTGHFTAAGLDPLGFIREYHERIYSLHMKDRTKNNGPKVPFGEGDTPLRQILLLLKQKEWKIPAHVEFAYPADDRTAETRRNFDWMKGVLTTG